MTDTLDEVFRREAGRCTATLIRVLGDIDLAEDALAEAFAIAAERWPNTGYRPTRAAGSRRPPATAPSTGFDANQPAASVISRPLDSTPTAWILTTIPNSTGSTTSSMSFLTTSSGSCSCAHTPPCLLYTSPSP